jgi:hypothetical protein
MESLFKSSSGRNELYVSKKRDKKLFDRRYINIKGSASHKDGYITDDTISNKSIASLGKQTTVW